MKQAAVLIVAATLAACGGAPKPIYDLAGVDQAKYNRDLAQCVDVLKTNVFSIGDPVEKCMTARGYRTLARY